MNWNWKQWNWPLGGFTMLYWLGIAGAVGIVLTNNEYLGADARFSPEEMRFLFAVSVGHMGVLVIAGVLLVAFAQPSSRLIAGTKVQTAGYLHTLIGFAAALLVATDQSAAGSVAQTLETLLFPMGTALVTSIIGWFAGGEIAGRRALLGPKSIVDETNRVATELERFAERARGAHETYIGAMENAGTTLKKIHKKQEAVLEDATLIAQTLNEDIFPPFKKTVDLLHQQAEALQTRLKEVTQGFEDHLGPAFLDTLSTMKTHGDTATAALKKTAAAAADTATGAEATAQQMEEARTQAEGIVKGLEGFAGATEGAHHHYVGTIERAVEDIEKDAAGFAEATEGAHHHYVGTIERAVEDIEKDGAGFAEATEEAHGHYVATLKRATESLRTLNDEQTEALKAARDIAKSLKRSLDPFSKAVERLQSKMVHVSEQVDEHLGESLTRVLAQINTQGDAAASAVKGMAEAADEAATYLRDGQHLVGALEELVRRVETREVSS